MHRVHGEVSNVFTYHIPARSDVTPGHPLALGSFFRRGAATSASRDFCDTIPDIAFHCWRLARLLENQPVIHGRELGDTCIRDGAVAAWQVASHLGALLRSVVSESIGA